MVNEMNYQTTQEMDVHTSEFVTIKWHQKIYYTIKCICDFLIALIALIVLFPFFLISK